MRATGTRALSDKSGDKSQVQVIARAAAILRVLEDEMDGLSLGQIAQRVSLARSTVQRIVGALAAEKFLIAASPNGRVRLGPTILRLAASARTDFVAAARAITWTWLLSPPLSPLFSLEARVPVVRI